VQQAGLWGKGFFGPFVPLQKGLAQEGEKKRIQLVKTFKKMNVFQVIG
jgi:hypothetical protein